MKVRVHKINKTLLVSKNKKVMYMNDEHINNFVSFDFEQINAIDG